MSDVPLGATIVLGDGARKGAPFHVLTWNDAPFCGRDVGGEMDGYNGRQRLCKNCVRVVARRVPAGKFFEGPEVVA